MTKADVRERHDTYEAKPIGVFLFLSEGPSHWIALLHMRERWPKLRFEMRAGYLQMRATEGE
jgi:hypothetical protein